DYYCSLWDSRLSSRVF
nr:immunoglobulin light chain junction region [Macaca mulatta]MOV72367.1 immunoglobulin light chain junction region [Macaca mulatta]MOV72548.1 immunoglobulin light chain junction region [Macaca mulatta]MOV72653.1 immunoglobulin light chain junction region [Macaca mulatta]MOV72697.1 immunoglobulin light chain junction region [Macaca mulatta]